jgi:hypothetical protein
MRALLVAAALCAACPAPDHAPSAPGVREPEMMLDLRDRGGAALAADARWLVAATWHAVLRVDKATGEVTELHVEPTGGILPSAIAMDAESVYFVVRGGCRDDLARAAECASIRAVRLDGGAARSVLELARGEEAPHALAPGTRDLYFLSRNRVMRVSKAGGAAEALAEAEERIRGLGADGDRVYYNDGTSLVSRAEGDARRVVGRVDPDGYVAIAFARASVYWIADGKVWRADKAGGASEVMGEARSLDAHLAADDAGLAWTEPQDQAIAVRRTDGQVGRARLREARPGLLAVDARFAFATAVDLNDGSTRIVRITR